MNKLYFISILVFMGGIMISSAFTPEFNKPVTVEPLDIMPKQPLKGDKKYQVIDTKTRYKTVFGEDYDDVFEDDHILIISWAKNPKPGETLEVENVELVPIQQLASSKYRLTDYIKVNLKFKKPDAGKVAKTAIVVKVPIPTSQTSKYKFFLDGKEQAGFSAVPVPIVKKLKPVVEEPEEEE